VIEISACVSYWPKADVASCAEHVCFDPKLI
jgi:hypothetical protein